MPKVKVYESDADTRHRRPIIRKYHKKPYNFMKWWRVVRYWAKRKYDLSTGDIEIILHLYDKDLFTRNEFREFEGLLEWDKTRFNYFRDKGYIVLWRDQQGYHRQAKLYTLSVGMKRMCDVIYKKLVGEETISENMSNNPVFKGESYADKMYRKAIRAMNKEIEKRKLEEEWRKATKKEG